jgi:hypothetical protein
LDGRRATGDGRRATGDGRRATGDGRRATRDVLFAARSANALHRLLDVLPVFVGDHHVRRMFTLVPGSEFGVDALAAIERVDGCTIPWSEAQCRTFDLIIAASPKGELRMLRGPRVLLPHGAGFGKTVPTEGSVGAASGLDPAFLLSNGRMLAALYGLAHPSQVTRLAAFSPQAAAHAAVVGDPTLDRILASRDRRDAYRAALGTGGRTLVVLTSTWGRESLLRRRPTLPADLASSLPHDAYQVALIVHPNERSRLGGFDLTEYLTPALDAGVILAGPYEEWGAVLVAADVVVSDHGSTALYAAALDCPLIAAYDGSEELIEGSPIAELLKHSPGLDDPGGIEAALATHRPGASCALAEHAFAEQGHALERLREELYRLLDLPRPTVQLDARPLPAPRTPVRAPAAFAVRAWVLGRQVRVERFPALTGAVGHHLAAEHGTAGERYTRSAGLLYRRTSQRSASPHHVTWTAAEWTGRILKDYPGCGTAAAIVSATLCIVRTRSGAALSVRIEPDRNGGQAVYADPAAVLSAVHAWLVPEPALPAVLTCLIGNHSYSVHVCAATAQDAAREF